MYITKIEIENIRCFKKFKVDFERDGMPLIWTTILGDNSTGKSTLLKSIAIGLCDESSAAGLLKETEQGFVRLKSKEANIRIFLKKSVNSAPQTIDTNILRTTLKKNDFERLRQTEVSNKFKIFSSWDDLFVCAYGIGRGTSGTGDISGYSAISALYNLFNYGEGLQNPELVFHRLKTSNKRDETKKSLDHILDLGGGERIYFEKDGIKIKGPWNCKIPLRDLADGYKSTFQWVMDFIGWAYSFNPKITKSSSINGILLIDALEEHLHPIWQRTIIPRLNKIFPNVQFIVTTHSPLIASSTTDVQNSQVINLALIAHNVVKKKIIKKEDLKGKRADQVLRSDAFSLPVTMSNGSITDIAKYSLLQSKKKLNKKERTELLELKRRFKKNLTFGDNVYEIYVKRAILEGLTKLIRKKPSEIFDLELNRQLKEIFKK